MQVINSASKATARAFDATCKGVNVFYQSAAILEDVVTTERKQQYVENLSKLETIVKAGVKQGLDAKVLRAKLDSFDLD